MVGVRTVVEVEPCDEYKVPLEHQLDTVEVHRVRVRVDRPSYSYRPFPRPLSLEWVCRETRPWSGRDVAPSD